MLNLPLHFYVMIFHFYSGFAMHRTKKPLNYLDFVVLSLIFFGYFTYVSITGYLASPVSEPISVGSFDNTANWASIATELVLLILALLYLLWRKFDFGLLNFSLNKATLPLACGLVLAGALATDLVMYGGYWLWSGQNPFSDGGQMGGGTASSAQTAGLFAHISLSLVVFSLVNGFFEELYFMGLAFAVRPQHRLYALITSVFVRFIFHIYQGILPALGIALTGVVFILLRQKIKSITPFVLAHAVFDVFGASVLFWLLSGG